MTRQNYLKMFIDDCKYYDHEQKEIKAILKSVDVKGKSVLDLGTGIGRLAFPLARYARELIALDQDSRLLPYFKMHQKKNVKFVRQSFEKYLKKKRIFDIVLLAWPTFDSRFTSFIKNAMDEYTSFIFLTCDNNSDWETVVDKVKSTKKKGFDSNVSNKVKSLKELPRQFKMFKKEKILTRYIYPDEKTAFRIFIQDFKMWFGLNLNEGEKQKLMKIILAHKKGKKIIFGEEVWMYVMRKKGGNHAR